MVPASTRARPYGIPDARQAEAGIVAAGLRRTFEVLRSTPQEGCDLPSICLRERSRQGSARAFYRFNPAFVPSVPLISHVCNSVLRSST